ncbi:MAG: hypothetical protein WBB27_09840 [Maribacter sp.]|jgi:hypothetical protein
MKSKQKALLFNFLGFAVIFLAVRFTLDYFFEANRFFLAFVSAIGATLASPKFAAIKTESGERISMKWIFRKN